MKNQQKFKKSTIRLKSTLNPRENPSEFAKIIRRNFTYFQVIYTLTFVVIYHWKIEKKSQKVASLQKKMKKILTSCNRLAATSTAVWF